MDSLSDRVDSMGHELLTTSEGLGDLDRRLEGVEGVTQQIAEDVGYLKMRVGP